MVCVGCQWLAASLVPPLAGMDLCAYDIGEKQKRALLFTVLSYLRLGSFLSLASGINHRTLKSEGDSWAI